jgi:hypothetical protein
MARSRFVLNSGADRHVGDHARAPPSARPTEEEAMNATPPRSEPRPDVGPAGAESARPTLSPDEARQGEVVFGKPWKRQVYFAVVAAVAAIGLVLIIAFT